MISPNAVMTCGGIFDYDRKAEQLSIICQQLEDPNIWNEHAQQAQELSKQRKLLENVVLTLQEISQQINDSQELFDLSKAENDAETLQSISEDNQQIEQKIAKLEFQRMFCQPNDANDCFLEIQSGAGGTEAQDWAEMLLRMYLKYAEKKGFAVELLEESPGDVAGIKSATIKIKTNGDSNYCYGTLRTETGVHRLVRKSPFDANFKRHTSFASVFVYPEIDDSIQIEINPADVRIDTFRASGAGGQHINKTDSAVRFTHLPTGIVVQCQNDRSQHRNRDEAWKMLRARLYELELRKKQTEQQKLESEKSDIAWGYQIRSYVLDQSRIKDLRTGYETGNTQAVLDGDLDAFIQESLKKGV